ncbi:hypothetical protein ACQ5SP_04445 [Rhodovulum sp. YNF3179]|uniref:hypothetical protein n=1 Tax=Rhodovulum sp. YNF3179 TaxID=3425127 RepID=UPI003D347325
MIGRLSLGPVALALAVSAGAAGCAPLGEKSAKAPEYMGVETRLLDHDLVNFRVAMRGARDGADVTAYADCAAAQYALIRGFGFARHVRTNVEEDGGLWRGDAVYTVSASLPRGVSPIDAEVVTAACADQGIPTV